MKSGSISSMSVELHAKRSKLLNNIVSICFRKDWPINVPTFIHWPVGFQAALLSRWLILHKLGPRIEIDLLLILLWELNVAHLLDTIVGIPMGPVICLVILIEVGYVLVRRCCSQGFYRIRVDLETLGI